MGGETNIPAFYSAAAMCCCAAMLAIIGIARKKFARDYCYWYFLAIIFVCLSMDEAL